MNMWNAIPHKRYRKKIKRVKKPKDNKRLSIHKFAKELNKNLSASERWFQALYKPYKVKGDKYNCPLHIRIPDLINKQYKYIVEVDGSIHDTEKQKHIDALKDSFYDRLDYTVFRVKAYDDLSFNIALQSILKIREPIKNNTTILRKTT